MAFVLEFYGSVNSTIGYVRFSFWRGCLVGRDMFHEHFCRVTVRLFCSTYGCWTGGGGWGGGSVGKNYLLRE